MTDPGFTCFDRVPPLVLHDEAADAAVAVNPANRRVLTAPGGFEAGGEPARFWRPGTRLRVRFLDGPTALHERVMEAARAWTEEAFLDFDVVDTGPADIRVSFVGHGNWSALGTDVRVADWYAPDEPTMCLSEVPRADQRRLERLARHEFGHAIGFIHEHSSPASGIRWNREAVLAALAAPPNRWTPAQVEFNFFRRYAATTTQHTDFDPESVMLYAFPATWTVGDVSHKENHELSTLDREFARFAYPRR